MPGPDRVARAFQPAGEVWTFLRHVGSLNSHLPEETGSTLSRVVRQAEAPSPEGTAESFPQRDSAVPSNLFSGSQPVLGYRCPRCPKSPRLPGEVLVLWLWRQHRFARRPPGSGRACPTTLNTYCRLPGYSESPSGRWAAQNDYTEKCSNSRRRLSSPRDWATFQSPVLRDWKAPRTCGQEWPRDDMVALVSADSPSFLLPFGSRPKQSLVRTLVKRPVRTVRCARGFASMTRRKTIREHRTVSSAMANCNSKSAPDPSQATRSRFPGVRKRPRGSSPVINGRTTPLRHGGV